MRKTRINASMLLFVSLLGLSSIVCVAAGLGNMHVESALGQPLKARIDLIGASSSDVGSMKVSLASAHSYKEIGAPYSATLASMRLVIVSGSAGTKPYVQVTSAVPVNDPAVDLLVKLSSADGTLVHEYPLLLDPVGYDTRVSNLPVINPQPVPRLSAASTTRRPPASSKTASIPALSATTGVEKRAGILGVHVQKGGLPYKKHSLIQKINRIKVHKGDSLTSIVLHAEPQVIDLDQALVAVYDANPHAFMGHNMNRLKSGVILQLPSVSEQKKVSPEKAMKQVAIQSRNWRIYRQKLAKAVMSERGRITARRHFATGTITAVTHGTSNELTKTHDVLKVTRGTVPSGQKTPEAVKHQDEVDAMQEDAIANQARLKEANARISQLEKTIKD
ncbi:MAG: hypothetical protein KGL58_04985, partial [Pseudomonadota bacterium]|nr:hypothetical protein [Pseudomonadota bacterium]